MNKFVVISPQEFKRAFLIEVNQKNVKKSLLRRWYTWRAYNKYFLRYRGVLDRTSKRLNRRLKMRLVHHREYWYIDAIWYVGKIPRHKSGGRTFADYYAAAIEHENDFSTSWQEMNKLCQLHSPLSVLIAYPDDRREALLERYAEICLKADLFGRFSKEFIKVAVFGIEPDERGNIKWEFYKYQRGRFQQF